MEETWDSDCYWTCLRSQWSPAQVFPESVFSTTRPHGGSKQIKRRSTYMPGSINFIPPRTFQGKHNDPITQSYIFVISTQLLPWMKSGHEERLLSVSPEQGLHQTHQSSSSATFFSNINAKAWAPTLPMLFPTRLDRTKEQKRVRAGRDLRKTNHKGKNAWHTQPHCLVGSLSDITNWLPGSFPSSPRQP